MNVEQKVVAARKRLLTATYGRFDLLPGLLSEEILRAKPRLVLATISEVFNIAAEDIPYKALSKWLQRYRKSSAPKQAVKETVLDDISARRKKIDEFKVSDPFAQPKVDLPVIKIL